ncbi:MAG: hypothetical protein PHW74_11295 [Desulfobacca sp.]|nr:hypothetical protein [Desulfobacca sp.]
MIDLEEFRSGQHGIPFSCLDQLPSCCEYCPYLIWEESTVCFCDAPFYYYCCYSWPDKLQDAVPPCLQELV